MNINDMDEGKTLAIVMEVATGIDLPVCSNHIHGNNHCREKHYIGEMLLPHHWALCCERVARGDRVTP